MIKKIFFSCLFSLSFILTTYASSLNVSIEGGNTKNVFYGEELSIVANATFPEGCSSTGIIWTKSVPGFPFPNIITIGNGPTYVSIPDMNQNITVTANCDAASVATFVFINIKNPEVSVGINTAYNFGDTVNLSGSIIGTPCTTFNYNWEQISGPTVDIFASGQTMVNSNTYNGASFVFPDTNEEIKLKLNVTPESCFHAGNTYSGTVIYTKIISGGGSGGGRSYSSKMRDEGDILFSDTGSISKILLDLKLYKQDYSPIMNFNWNYIGGDGQVYYYLEYSTGAKFEKFKSFETTSRDYNFIEYDLDKESFVHYFRVKSGYLGKYSGYSNIYKYYTNDYLKIGCKDCNKKVSFEDIFENYDFLIDKYYKTICPNFKCKKK